jgi:alpha-glucoside transport system substrate-binding protein
MRTSRTTPPLVKLALVLTAVTLLAAACGNGAGDDDGTTAVLLTAFTEGEDVAGVEAMIAAFEDANPGMTIQHEGSPAFEEAALTRVEGGNPPDMMFHPQPGVLRQFAERGAARPLDFLDTAAVEADFVPGLLDIGTFDDTLYGLQVRLTLKSLVWYPIEPWNAGGYQVPQTWDEMLALSAQIAADGIAPWCVGIESGDATGWVFTDWIEDVMLRLHGPDVYDQWTSGELGFNSPEVRAAFEQVADIWFTDEWVLGGRPSIVQTSFQAAPAPMFEDPPACMLHRQASFAPQLFPDGTEFGTDYDFFFVPQIDSGVGNGALLAGDLLAIYTDNEAARAFIQFAATSAAQEAWAAEGSYLCASTGCNPAVYPNDALRQQGELLQDAAFARFDGSDLMPAEVGAGAFWRQPVAWIVDQQDLDTTLSNIDAAWPGG